MLNFLVTAKVTEKVAHSPPPFGMGIVIDKEVGTFFGVIRGPGLIPVELFLPFPLPTSPGHIPIELVLPFLLLQFFPFSNFLCFNRLLFCSL